MTNHKKPTGQRPSHVKPPAHLSKNPPVPKPDPLGNAEEIKDSKDPTRYGDWVRKGIAVDF